MKCIYLLTVAFLGASCGKQSKAPDKPEPKSELVDDESSKEGDTEPPIERIGNPEIPELGEGEELAEPKPEKEAVPPKLKAAVEAAASGPELKGFMIYGEQWNVKPVDVITDGNLVVVSGRISHHILFSPDDQVDYSFTFEEGKIVDQSFSVQSGGYAQFAPTVLSILRQFVAIPIQDGSIISIIERIEAEVMNEEWQGKAQALSSALALYVYNQQSN